MGAGELLSHDGKHGHLHRHRAGQARTLGLEENTYVFFSSDNGGGSSNAPLQGGKAKMWEGGIGFQ